MLVRRRLDAEAVPGLERRAQRRGASYSLQDGTPAGGWRTDLGPGRPALRPGPIA